MYLYELYKDLYDREMQERQFYDGRLPFTLSLLSATATIMLFFLSDFETNTTVVKGMIAVSVMLFVIQFVLTFKAYFSWGYKYYDFPVNEIEKSIKDHYGERRYKKINHKELASDDWIYGMLSRTYAFCSSKYYEQNLKKRRAHHLLNLISYINLCVLFLTFMIMKFFDI